MARLQIVPLPSLTVGAVSQPEFLIVLDEVDDGLVNTIFDRSVSIKENRDRSVSIKEASGARGILVFTSTIEVVR